MIALPPILLVMSLFAAISEPATFVQPRGANHLPLLVFSLIVMIAAIIMWIVAVGYRSRRTV